MHNNKQTALDITQQLYSSIGETLSRHNQNLLDPEQVKAATLAALSANATDIVHTPHCAIDKKSITATQSEDGTVHIDYKASIQTLHTTYTFNLDPSKNPVLKYLSRCEACRTANGGIKLRWFWKSGVLTDFSNPEKHEKKSTNTVPKPSSNSSQEATSQKTRIRCGTITMHGTATDVKRNLTVHDNTYSNSFAFTPVLLTQEQSLAWNELFPGSELQAQVSDADKNVLEDLAKKIIEPGSKNEQHNSRCRSHHCCCDHKAGNKCKGHVESSHTSISSLRKRLLQEHYDDYATNNTTQPPKTKKKLTRKQRKQLKQERLQLQVTKAIEYTDAFTEHCNVDTEAVIRYRLERVQRQLEREARQRMQAGEEHLPRARARYYAAASAELNRQLEQCERFNIWAEHTEVLHNMHKLATR